MYGLQSYNSALKDLGCADRHDPKPAASGVSLSALEAADQQPLATQTSAPFARHPPIHPNQKSHHLLHSVQSSRTEQSPTVFGHIYTQLYRTREVQLKEQG